MPKNIDIDPNKIFAKDFLKSTELPIHQYQKSIDDELKIYGKENLKEVLRHMYIVREFENMLNSFKTTGSYKNINYTYNGPAHLSIGQEAAAVGAAFALKPEDKIFGSHRSHGEMIAKGLSAIKNLSRDKIKSIMQDYNGGKLISYVHKNLNDKEFDDAEMFLLSGVLAEIFMRELGFNKGMGGSMHAFFTPFGTFPNNAIVGGSSGIAVGAALHAHLNQEESICVANLGDGSTGCGLVWESMNFSSMGQYKNLWPEPYNKNPPMLFCFMNNFYAMGGQTLGETMSWDRLSRIATGVNSEQMHAETINGSDPLSVADAIIRKRKLLIEGNGPILLDIECYRYSGHSTTDTNAYRSRDEIKHWKFFDPIQQYSEKMIEAGIINKNDLNNMSEKVQNQIEYLTSKVVDRELTPSIDIEKNPTIIGDFTFNKKVISVSKITSDLLKNEGEVNQIKSLQKKSRFGKSEEGSLLSGMRAITLRDSLAEAIIYHLSRDKSLIAYGEECRDWGGAFGVYRGFSDIIPINRLFNSPISEAAIVSTAIGYAISGGRAIIELMYSDFIGRAGDEIFNQLAKWQAMSAGELNLPIVLRASIGSKYGAQHSQDWTSLLTHIPGLSIVYPATPYDAKGLMASSLCSNDPTVFFESQRLYDKVEIFTENGVPKNYYKVPFGKAVKRRSGKDITILTIGASLYAALDASMELINHNIDAEIIDARSLVPFDYEMLLNSVKLTGRLLIVSEAVERGSFANTIATNVSKFAFKNLRASPMIIGSPNWIAPGADMEKTYSPQSEDILDLVFRDFFPEKRINKRGLRKDWDFLDLAKKGL